jgi:hypothetical protein
MNPQRFKVPKSFGVILGLIAIIVASFSVWLQAKREADLNARVFSLIEHRERVYCQKLAENLNKSRDMMGQAPVSPTNFPDLLNAFFESLNGLFEGASTNKSAR